MGVIGQRAAEAVRKMAEQNETSYEFELDCLNISRTMLYHWEHGISDPRAQTLQTMAFAGYDVHHILTGAKNNGKQIS